LLCDARALRGVVDGRLSVARRAAEGGTLGKALISTRRADFSPRGTSFHTFSSSLFSLRYLQVRGAPHPYHEATCPSTYRTSGRAQVAAKSIL